jgi:hypothetical protein
MKSLVIAVLGLVACGGEQKEPADAARPVATAVADAAVAPLALSPDAALVRTMTLGEVPEGVDEALSRLRGVDGELLELPKLERRLEASTEPVDGSLTSTQIDRVIKSSAGVLRACYQKQLATRPELAGKLTVAFTIAKDGTIAKAVVDREASTLHDERVEACVLRQLGKLRFPAAKTEAKVRYPLLFSAPR